MNKRLIGMVICILFIAQSVCFALKLPKVDEKRIIYIEDSITMQKGIEVSKLIEQLDKTDGDIRIVLTTPGGNVTAGLMIIDSMDNCNNDIQTIANGFCMSMGTYILAHGTKGKRAINKNGLTLVHHVRAQLFGMFTFKQLKEIALGIKKDTIILRAILHKDTNLSIKKIIEIENTEKEIDADRTIDLNIVDGYYEGEE